MGGPSSLKSSKLNLFTDASGALGFEAIVGSHWCYGKWPSNWLMMMYGLLTKCEVKMAGNWPSSFFACLWTETKSRSMNSQKPGQYPAILTEQT